MKLCRSDVAISNLQRLLLASFALIAWTAPSHSQAQNQGNNPLTPKYLIGDAVSLSNQEYPEIEKAILRFRNNDALGSQEYLEKAKKKYPKLAPADIMMAKMRLLTRDARAVHFFLERAAQQHPKDPESYLMLADLAFQGQRTTEAMTLFAYATPLVKDFKGNEKRKQNFKIRVLAGRAAVAERRKQWDEASKLLTQWIEINPESHMAHTRMGIAQFRLGNSDKALAEFSNAKEINPKVTHPLITLAQLHFADGENDKARALFEKAYANNKSDPLIAQAYAEWLIQQGELAKAQAITAELRKQTPDSVTALVMDGVIAYMQNDSKRAEQALQKVLSLDPRNARATDLMALLLIQSDDVGDRERALQYAQNNAERLANNAQTNVTRAYILYELGRKAEAQKSLAAAGKLQIMPDSTYLIAKILVAENQNDKAIEALKKIVAQKTGLQIFRNDAIKLLAKLEAEKKPAGSE